MRRLQLIAVVAVLSLVTQARAAATFTLVPEAVQGSLVMGPVALPSAPPTTITIKLVSTVFPTDSTLSFRLFIEESFDGGVTFKTASGFPSTAVGGNAGQPTKVGGVTDGVPTWEYDYDGRARQVRVTMTPFVGGTGAVVIDINDPLFGLSAGSVPGSYDWGLTATLQ